MRDDFSKPAIDALAKRVGVRCSNPGCRKLTTGPRDDPHKIVNIGVAAHITAASPGGPRYEGSLTSEERGSAANGLWLCQNCAKLIDSDVVRYTVEMLHHWKLWSENATLTEIEGREFDGSDPADGFVEIDISYRRVNIKSDRHDYLLDVTISNRGNEPVSSFHVDIEFPSRVLEDVEANRLHVPGRSTSGTELFRVSHRSDGRELFPGDSELVMSLPYHMDHGLFWSRGDLFDQKVRATFYQTGFRPLRVERPFGLLQIF